MSKSYKHLGRDERDLIAMLHSQGHSIRAIAAILGRSPATISRELKRNALPGEPQVYIPNRAQRQADERWRHSHQRPRLKSRELKRYVRRKLKQGWSPEQIAGRLRHEDRHPRISHEAIYQWVYLEAPDLTACLTRSHRKRYPRGYRKHTRSLIPGRVPLEERPAEVDWRQQAGHWEVDTAHFRVGGAMLVVAVERKTRYIRLRHMKRKTARGFRRILVEALQRYPPHLLRTLTYDNGGENLEHLKVNAMLGTRSYFCDPYQSWQKGSVENSIGIVRRLLPKAMDFAEVSEDEVRRVERRLNDKPRKCLGFKTPKEAFRDERCTCR